MFNRVKEYYETGLWSIDRVFNVVGKAISEEEYQEITGFLYPAKS
ncbi:hypothetical protein Amet_4341 [Alkaliphilus metalliredigens QYMF]|uniref:XkdX family protein n=1 Tax=Alkaliphilus metalliredigens (strain QYMF) TaxID=293826 RepID=A6TKF0_ALKMQ|nr:XkdX family protein [Alkaliphilus metalliredigens]ABR46668.1 hypothetical protein Amet_0440 [Alkaliphilus metalliredigens QYMF]ABR48140.1 hypothetical protein Amet_1977 [Alkaliphilus metalliredigens QYMF]ABR50415.1 hypothetical protein Amet_4341 [Alkaliphilus metalliredigens QYMF]